MSHPHDDLFYVSPDLAQHLICETLGPDRQLTLSEAIDQVTQAFKSSLTPTSLQSINGRLERGLEMAKNGSVQEIPNSIGKRRFLVRSSDGTQKYIVDLDTKSCECPDSQKGYTCKHRIAAYLLEQAQQLVDATIQKKPSGYPPKTIRPTCSIPPSKEPPFRPTCSIPPTKAEFEKAEKSSEPVPGKDPSTASRIEQALKILGYDSAPNNVAETSLTGARLGNLYRRYLHGEDLDQRSFQVTITNLTKETVTPHPSQPSYEKWCLWVSGLPQGMPNGILFGPQGDKDLVAIFGRVDINALNGKMLVIYPQPMNVAGQSRVSIRFRSTK